MKYLVSLVMALVFHVGMAHALLPVEVTASGYQEPNRPQNSIDNREETRWSCEGTCWIQYDFGKEVPLAEMALFWRNPDKRTQSFSIETSLDGNQWDLRFNGETEPAPGPSSADTHSIDADIRYVRITGYGNSYNDWNSLNEVEFGIEGSNNPIRMVADVIAVEASGVIDGNIANYAEDGDLKTFWTGGKDDYIEWELEDEAPVIQVEIAWMNGRTRKQKYAIEISLDGEDWERIIEDTSSGATQGYETNLFPGPQLAKFVRIVNNGGNTSRIASSRPKISIAEVGIFVTDSDQVEMDGIRFDGLATR